MNQELEFAKKIEELTELASIQGNVVSKGQIIEALSEIGMDESQLGPVYDYLKSKKIGVGEKVDLDKYLSSDEIDYLELYTESLSDIPKLTDGEKRAVYMAAMAGETEAKKKLIESMLSDVVDMAKLYTGQGVFIEDLIGEGNVALSVGVEMLGALEEPDEVPGMLAKMAMDAMEEVISDEIGNRKTDDKLVNKVNTVADAARELASVLGRKVTIDELVSESNLSRKAIEEAIRISGGKIEDIG